MRGDDGDSREKLQPLWEKAKSLLDRFALHSSVGDFSPNPVESAYAALAAAARPDLDDVDEEEQLRVFMHFLSVVRCDREVDSGDFESDDDESVSRPRTPEPARRGKEGEMADPRTDSKRLKTAAQCA
jgi:hypothetical protein